jgi:hypothetical protein
MNSHFLQQKLGSPVLFGDIIQLFHVKSGKYLTVSPTELGKTEKENVRIYLNPDGDSNSWLQILPRFKIDREGDRVAGSTEAYFRFADRANEFLHCAVTISIFNFFFKLLFKKLRNYFRIRAFRIAILEKPTL